MSRLSPRDEIAASVELWQLWQRVSGYTDTGGVEPFLQKPFAPAQLLGKVATVLGADENGRPTPPSA